MIPYLFNLPHIHLSNSAYFLPSTFILSMSRDVALTLSINNLYSLFCLSALILDILFLFL